MFVSLPGKTGPGRSKKSCHISPKARYLHRSKGTVLSDKSKRPFVSLSPTPWFKPTSINLKYGAREKYKSSTSAAESPAIGNHRSSAHRTPRLFLPNRFWVILFFKNPLPSSLKHWVRGIIVDKNEAWAALKIKNRKKRSWEN